VEWSNHDPDEPHTNTFGTEPPPNEQFPPSSNVTVDSDGALHAVITAPGESVHSGFIEQALEDEFGVLSNTLAANPTRFRVTFTQAGTYNYKCVLHDNLGMVGKVIVLP
jgi:plastocyanin